MVQRGFWLNQINEAWKRRSLVWLSGVRRAGKTFLSQSLADIEYFDCELPRVRRMMEDPEGFLKSLRGKRIVLDEIHRLDHPSEILKIDPHDRGRSGRLQPTGTSSSLPARRSATLFCGGNVTRAGVPGMDGCLLGEGYSGTISVRAAPFLPEVCRAPHGSERRDI
ncbi:MAG: AAA family ATPase [Deltaproteobacteria bacterium]|nr:AAA family ATPase [Deltaproteobacteria bacterium]